MATFLRIEGNKIYFEHNRQQHFDAIILATGYGHNLESFLQINQNRLPISTTRSAGNPGLEPMDYTSADFMFLPAVC
jgi:hypothetical protein